MAGDHLNSMKYVISRRILPCCIRKTLQNTALRRPPAFIEEVEKVGAAPVSLIATRFHSRAIIDRRAW
jgi:hypothetical protein